MKENSRKSGMGVVCILLTVVLTACVLYCMVLHAHIAKTELPKAASVLHPDESTKAKTFLKTCLPNASLTEEQVEDVLDDGTFCYIFADKVYDYNQWLRGEITEFPEITADECVAAVKGNLSVLYRETKFQFTAEEESLLRENIGSEIVHLNDKYSTGLSAFLMKAAAAGWLTLIPGILLIAVLIWMIVVYVRSGKTVGNAVRAFGIAAMIPCILLILLSLFGSMLLDDTLYGDAVRQLNGTWLLHGIIGMAASIVLVAVGMLMKKKGTVPASEATPSAPAPAASETPAASVPQQEGVPPVTRHYCKFCGELLVNDDAKFCYKCGKQQEQSEKS